ncbi:MAG TPA: hypothetical protein VGR15_08955 [Bacteroidota bacterium]|jgi:hypothetical protein|nr:hypothetical protein [Bacteroidota bacterium]
MKFHANGFPDRGTGSTLTQVIFFMALHIVSAPSLAVSGTGDHTMSRVVQDSLHGVGADHRESVMGDRRGLFDPIELDLTFGVAFPRGDFSSISVGNPNAGAARRGLCFGLDATYRMTESWGLSAGSFLSFNGVDSRVLGLPSDLTVSTNSWRTVWVLVGPRYSARVSTGAVLELTGQIGLLSGTSPEISFDFGNQHLSQGAASSTAPGFRLGVGIVYKEKGIIGLTYMGGTPSYTITATDGQTTISSTPDQPTSLLSFVVGMRF